MYFYKKCYLKNVATRRELIMAAATEFEQEFHEPEHL